MSQENLHKPEGVRLRLNDFGGSSLHVESMEESFLCYIIFRPFGLLLMINCCHHLYHYWYCYHYNSYTLLIITIIFDITTTTIISLLSSFSSFLMTIITISSLIIIILSSQWLLDRYAWADFSITRKKNKKLPKLIEGWPSCICNMRYAIHTWHQLLCSYNTWVIFIESIAYSPFYCLFAETAHTFLAALHSSMLARLFYLIFAVESFTYTLISLFTMFNEYMKSDMFESAKWHRLWLGVKYWGFFFGGGRIYIHWWIQTSKSA